MDEIVIQRSFGLCGGDHVVKRVNGNEADRKDRASLPCCVAISASGGGEGGIDEGFDLIACGFDLLLLL